MIELASIISKNIMTDIVIIKNKSLHLHQIGGNNMHQTTNKQHKYYFPDKLKKQLIQMSQYPLTVIEAPGGFGKTTAVREYLKNEHPQAVCEWYTCLDEPLFPAWSGIIELFSRINCALTDDIKNLKMPTMDVLLHVKSCLKGLNCPGETYLVIDNYHLTSFDMRHELISIFSMHENPNLHMIFIMQQLDSRNLFPMHNDTIHVIKASCFSFDRDGISALFHMEGLRLSKSEIEDVFSLTEGWIAAIRLHMINYKETGSFDYTTEIEQLVETAVWNKLMPAEKEFILAVSVFDSFTAHQAAAMLDNVMLPGRIETKLKTNSFMRFLPDKHLFIIHSTLLEYLRNQLCYYRSKEYRNQILYKAGMSCAETGQYCSASKFFYKLKDFNSIMSLPFTRQYLDTQKEECEGEFFITIVQECPEEILFKHPSTMIIFAHYALLNGRYELYEKLCRLLRLLIQGEENLPQKEVRRLTGELILLESLGSFNDLTEMRRGYDAASEILGKSPDIMENSAPWLSVFPTAFGMFWRESGKADEMLNAIDEIRPIYHKFNRGQGAGLSHLIRAEAMLTRGKDDEAEILCHMSLYEARAHEQTSICIYAELCLVRIFILRGDAKNFFTSLNNIQNYSAIHSDLSTCRMAEICLSIISLILGIKDNVAPWLYNIEGIRKSLNTPVVPFAEMIYFSLLLMDKRYNELYAVIRLALDTLRDPDSKIKYMMPQVYYLIFLAVAKHNNGNDVEAQGYLNEALDIALPDQIYLPFADHECMEYLLSGPNVICSDKKGLASLISICKRQTSGVNIIKKALIQNISPLTPREREIASLAKRRLSAKEIAAKLYISEKTVKSTLNNVYSKLGIHSKRELAVKEF